MATITSNLVHDNTNFTTFFAWAKPISDNIRTLNWIQSNDTGQVVWVATVLTCSQVAVSGGNSVYTFSSYTGPNPRVGMSVTVSVFATGGNNVTATITALTGGTGGGAGTFTVATTTQVNETHAGSATTTAITLLPGISTWVYEIWIANDAFQATCPIFFKIEYGTSTGATYPAMAMQVSAGSNGTGTLTSAGNRHYLNGTTPVLTLQECNFAGDGTQGRLGWELFRNSGSTYSPWNFAIERSRDNSGAVTGDYFTYAINGYGVSYQAQRSWAAGVGATVELAYPSVIWAGGLAPTTGSFANYTYFSPVYPMVGAVCNPMTMCGACRGTDVAEGANFTATIYGTTYTFKPTKNSAAGSKFGDTGSYGAFCLGWY